MTAAGAADRRHRAARDRVKAHRAAGELIGGIFWIITNTEKQFRLPGFRRSAGLSS
jgi:hypothetical protein